MKLQNMLTKAQGNKTKVSQTTLSNGLTVKVEYRPYGSGYNGKYSGRTFYAYLDNELVGDVYLESDNSVTMWSDSHSYTVENLTEPKHIEHVYSVGYIEY